MKHPWLVTIPMLLAPGACAALPGLGLVAMIGSTPTGGCGTNARQPTATNDARTGIPATYLTLYQHAGRTYGIGWNVLAAIGRVESDHGANPGTSTAGARGPMQFMPATWSQYGVDGNHDGRTDITDPADAIPTAARYLKANGAPTRMRHAIYAYNHSWNYVDQVLAYARKYGGTQAVYTGAAASGADPDQQQAISECGAVAAAAPNEAAAKIINYAKAQLGKPYVYGAQGPNAFDCSGLTTMAYHAAGITIPRTSDAQYWHGPRIAPGTEQPGDLVYFDYHPGMTGPGHVGIVYNPNTGTMIVAPHTGDVVKYQNYNTYPGGPVGFTRPARE